MFKFNGHLLPYFKHDYNHASENDRTIEVSIAEYYIGMYCNDNWLEIGNVLPHYWPDRYKARPWPVLDKYSKGCINEDITDYVPENRADLVISISTFEHIGFNESKYAKRPVADDSTKLLRAVEQVRHKILTETGIAMITMPVGFNPNADNLVFEEELFDCEFLFRRISADNRWEECSAQEARACKFGTPYKWGNGLVVGIVNGQAD